MAKEKAKEILCHKKNSAVERFKAGSTMVSAIAAALPRRASTVANVEVPASRMYNTQPKLSIASIIFARK
uniref:Uncharacterized protein n=1 Tax=Acrobeloides nanus TaxID=290746 RepID=A0A914DQ29_9BILA